VSAVTCEPDSDYASVNGRARELIEMEIILMCELRVFLDVSRNWRIEWLFES